MKRTLFDSLAISDSERIHSQTIAWIFSLDDEILNFNEKSKILKNIFKITEEFEISSIIVETELNRIDIFIQTDQDQFIIENKLKSSEHSEQTSRYMDSIPYIYKDDSKTKHFGFLTLINEMPKNETWIPITFSKLKESLSEIELDCKKKESIFISEYCQTLENLVTTFNAFMYDHLKFENVFKDGYKKKYEKERYDNPLKDYIRVNQLETIFQKAFFRNIAKDSNLPNYEINETRGTALIQSYFYEFQYKGKQYRIGLQFQGNTFKINLADKNYATSKANQIDEQLTNVFMNVFHKQNNFNKFNKPRTKAYISVSKKTENMIYAMQKEQIVEMISGEADWIKSKVIELENIF
ncbi:unnamed protein product [marine sediment metagenome]|uniref:Uncharacterized protein n=1 Tax=marine sediment metagenome TaxID=412755 RepID=X1T4V1_9ZZZZ